MATPIKSWHNFVCGFGAAITETTALHPLTKLIFRQKLHNIYAHQAAKQLFSEGSRHLYRGLLLRLLQKAPTRAIMFGAFDYFSVVANCGPTRSFNTCHAFAAFFAGTLEAVLTPFERLQTLMQSEKYNRNFRHTGHAFYDIRVYGLFEYYRGTGVIVIRNGTSNVFFFGLREPLHDLITRNIKTSITNQSVAEFASRFLSGAVLGAIIAVFNFPLNVIRVRSQSKLGGKFDSSLVVFKRLMKERNYKLKHLYRGVHLTCAKCFLSWGITNAVYEFLKSLIESKY